MKIPNAQLAQDMIMLGFSNALVKISDSYSFEKIKLVLIFQFVISSRMKWQSTSICLVDSSNNEFLAIYNISLLLQ